MTKAEKTVCVFCGSSPGNDPKYLAAARELGQLFLDNNWGLVYGGGTTGIMGEIAKSIASNGGEVEGIIPEALIKREQGNRSPEESVFGKTTVVTDMHTRKRLMAQKSEAFIALPGGYGTAEELFEVTTWNQLGIHSMPIVILNIDGFYDGLVSWINDAIKAGFISPGNGQIVVSARTAKEAIDAVNNYEVAHGRFNLDWSAQTPIQANPK